MQNYAAALLLAFILLSLLLLSGCLSNPAPEAPASNLSIPGISSNASNASPKPLPALVLKPNCALSVFPPRILAGQNATLSIYSDMAGIKSITYPCGNETREFFSPGQFNMTKSCAFGAPGVRVLSIESIYGPCANATLEVMENKAGNASSAAPSVANSPPASRGSCSIIEGTRKSMVEPGLWTYEARVQYVGYPQGSNLTWDCQYKKFVRTMGSASVGAGGVGYVSGILNINCQYQFYPGKLDILPVHVNDDYCGNLLQ